MDESLIPSDITVGEKRPRDDENPQEARSPPRVRRFTMDSVMSRGFQMQNGAVLSSAKTQGVSCLFVCLTPATVRHDVSQKKNYAYKMGTFTGVLIHLNPKNTDPYITIPVSTKGDLLKEHLGYITKHHPKEVYTPLEPIQKLCYTPIDITTFSKGMPEEVYPGDVLGITDLMANISFTTTPKQSTDGNGDETGKIRHLNVPYLTFKADVYLKGPLSFEEFKRVAERSPLKSNLEAKNRFLDEDGNLTFPPEVCYPNPSLIDRTPIPMFTRLNTDDLQEIWAALYNPRPSGFGIIRNRLILYDDPPKHELELERGLPLFLTSIPRLVGDDARDVVFKNAKDIHLKCLRGPPDLNLLIAREYPANRSRSFTTDDPVLCLAFSVYENRPYKKDDVPMYVSSIAILPVEAWKRYSSQIMRGLEALVFVKKHMKLSEEFTLTEVPFKHQCTEGIRGTFYLIPHIYKTFMGAALRVKASLAIQILVDAQVASGVKGIQPGTLIDRYNLEDRVCAQFIQNRNSVTHFFVNSFKGAISDLPNDDDPEFEYFLIPSEASIQAYQVLDKLRTEIDVIRTQGFWLRNHDPEWATKNDELVTDTWRRIPQVSENIGVFCVRRD